LQAQFEVVTPLLHICDTTPHVPEFVPIVQVAVGVVSAAQALTHDTQVPVEPPQLTENSPISATQPLPAPTPQLHPTLAYAILVEITIIANAKEAMKRIPIEND
jgi:hypothetical protein